MHIPDGFLDPKISTGLMGAAGFALAYSLAKVRTMVTALKPAEALATTAGNISRGTRRFITAFGKITIYKMGMLASMIFIAQMFDFTIYQGTSGHLFGGVLAAVILGPFAGTIVISSVLTAQAVFLADGGLLALGANIVNMAVIGTLAAYYIYYFLKKVTPEWMAIVVAAWASVTLMALACALEIGASGTLPYSVVIPSMLKTHMVIGIAEALITLALINILRSLFKEEA